MKKLVHSLVCFAIAATMMTGCSVGMAMKGTKDPDLRVIRAGAHRAEIELQLGYPISSQKVGENTLDIYEIEIGNNPSAGRAMGHAVMDIITLGLWEIAGTPIEATTGEKKGLAVTYDKDDIAIRVGSSAGAVPKKEVRPQVKTESAEM